MRKLSRVLGGAAAITLAGAALAGCSASAAHDGPTLSATSAYVQVPKSAGQKTVGYLDIRNNGAADTLESVTTSVGGTVSLRGPERPHMTPVVMRTLHSIPVPSQTMTQLVPNGYHLLIKGEKPMRDGKDITLKLRFAHGGTITVLALVTNPQNGGASYFLN
ncbi:MAG: copper chaperone PCu(A)C [Streptosporangiales bacterium]|jgi:copper(I)-binding protein|nr:copper chaperone PCu(A)C [Streptosporangiales bacterium]